MNQAIKFPAKMMSACVVLLCFGLAAAGCGGNGETRVPSSGDPQADRRAEQRVGSKDKNDKDNVERTLYERLGGAKGITALVDDSTARVIADPRVNFERKDVRRNFLTPKYDPWKPTPQNIDRFKRHMVEFLTLAAGGPSKYTGRELRIVHDGMRITNNEFDAMVGDIKASMDKLGFQPAEQRDLLAIIETTRKQIVEEH